MSRPNVTREDVARRAGVSTASVSYVLNNGPKSVSEATQRRVMDAVDELGYRPNSTARALSRGRVDMFGIVVHDSRNSYFAELVYAVDVVAHRAGRTLLVMNSDARREGARDQVAALAAQQVDGMIVADVLSTAEHQYIASLGVPVVLISQYNRSDSFTSIGVDYYDGAYRGVQHLIEHGHTQIAFVGGEPGVDPRERGWTDALADSGLELGPRYRVGFGQVNGWNAGMQIAAQESRPTAVFVASDQLAISLMGAIHASGFSVPRDIAVVAFDGTQEARYCWPPLTTMAQPIETMAEEAISRLISGTDEAEFVHFPTTLEIRESCGCVTSGSQ